MKSTTRNSKKNILIVLIVLLNTYKITSFEFNCNLDSNPSADFKSTKVQKGKETLLCIHFLPFYIKLAFKINVDEHTVVTGKSSYDIVSKKDVDIVVQLTGSEQFSQQIPYFRKEDTKVFPIISILIHTDEGLITKIELEDLKDGCPDNNIVQEVLDLNLSFTSVNEIPLCYSELCQNNDDGPCDIKVFVSWVGTDINGNTMISNSERILNFAKYNLPAMYESITKMDNNTGDDAKDNFNYNDIPEDVRSRLEEI